MPNPPTAIRANEAPPRAKSLHLPTPFSSMMTDRVKRPLGDIFGLASFGVNHVRLPAGAVSALHHRHSVQNEFVFVVSGAITLIHDAGETKLTAGMCIGFARGGTAHHLENRSGEEATYLEIGDRPPRDKIEYPRDDIQAIVGSEGKSRFAHKDGTPYKYP